MYNRFYYAFYNEKTQRRLLDTSINNTHGPTILCPDENDNKMADWWEKGDHSNI